ncbi:MAG TPA: hypothetical protein VL463_08350 [Kofleriaceae bacterium]|nr:hypothetical protein [Kofleriaceae bacterium]
MTDYQPPTQAELTELEIAAFMGPHIKRARLALVIVGALYALAAGLHYSDISKLHDAVSGRGDSEIKSLVDKAYYFVVFTGIAGVANLALAAIAGKKASFAMYAAMAIFAAYTLFELSLGVAFFLDWLWWLTAITVGMGFQAAYKADKLRRDRAAGVEPALSL